MHTTSRRRPSRGSLVLPWLALLCAPAASQTLKLSGPMVQPVGGRIDQRYLLSPDGQRLVYCADQDTDEMYELYSVPFDGSAPPVKLNGPLIPTASVGRGEFTITPDSARVVYLAQEEVYLRENVYSVPIDGSAARIALPLPRAVAGGFLSFCRATPDGTRVVYLRDGEALYEASIDGSGSGVLLSGAATFVDEHFVLDATGSAVFYLADRDTPAAVELYRTALDGSATTVRLSGTLAPGGGVRGFLPSPDGEHLVYVGAQESAEVFELFSVAAEGGVQPVKLSGALVPGGDVQSIAGLSFAILPDSSGVVYLADASTDEVTKLYCVPLDGSARPARINGTLVAGGDVESFAIAQDSASVVYRADQDEDDVVELYRASLEPRRLRRATLSAQKLNGALVAGGDVVGFQLAPDGRVAYRADQELDERFEVFVAAPGSPPVKLNDPLDEGHDVTRQEFTPDGARVLYTAGPSQAVVEIFSAPADASAPAVRLNPPLPEGGSVTSFEALGGEVTFVSPRDAGTVNGGPALYVAPEVGGSVRILTPELVLAAVAGDVIDFQLADDDTHVVYLADQELDARNELYGVPVDAASTPVKLNGPLVAGGNVGGTFAPVDVYRITPDGGRVVYLADQETNDVVELYAVPSDASAPPVKLNPPLSATDDVLNAFRIDPGSTRAFFRVQRNAAQDELWSAALLGTPSLTLLHAPAGDIDSLAIGADGTRIAYRSALSGQPHLWSTASDGSESPLHLCGAAGTTAVQSFALDPAGTRAVYLADQALDEAYELHVVPLDGSASALRLNDPLLADRDVTDFLIAADGLRVVYLADQDVNERPELFSVPIDRSSAPVRLNDPLGLGGRVGFPGRSTVAISADSSRVVYLVRASSAAAYELFSVPVDRSSPPVRLNAPLVAGGNVGANPTFFALAPDARDVLYVADQETDELVELFVAPIDGRHAPRKLSRPVPGEDVRSITIDPHGLLALYSSAAPFQPPQLLFAVPIDGSGPPFELAADPMQHRFTSDGKYLVHRAELDDPFVTELYSTRMLHRTRKAELR